MSVEVAHLALRGPLVAAARAADQRLFEQPVVLAEAHEHAGEQPRDRGLGQFAGAPDAEGRGGALGGARRLILGLQRCGHLRHAVGAVGQVPLQQPELPPQVAQQLLPVDRHQRIR